MKITVKEVRRVSGRHEVVFSCGAGNGAALWAGQEAPVLSRSYDVDDSIESGRNATLTEAERCGLSVEGEMVAIRGYIDSLDEDGMIYFRLAPDCLLMIESDDEELEEGSWLQLVFPTRDLKLTPLGK